MSTKSKLLAMTENLGLEPIAGHEAKPPVDLGAPVPPPTTSGTPGPGIRFPPVPTGPVPRTGPGQMLQFRGQILAAEGEVGKLRERLKAHDGALPTRRLDAASIVPSRWANRHADAFTSPEFGKLKLDIEAAGGNVQAISVRPLSGSPDRYEIVFGHRRHRACAELGLPVLATIDDGTLSDAELFSAMDRENRERADLSPYEQGLMYRRALDEKLYPSNRRLAEALGVSHTWVANVLLVADLPAPLLDCFRSPLEVQHRHARPLMVAYDTDRKALLRRAERLRLAGRPQGPAAVVEALTAVVPPAARDASKSGSLSLDGRKLGEWARDRAGRLTVTLQPGVVAAEDTEAFLAAVTQHLAS